MTANGLLVEPAYRSGPEFSRTLGPEVADLAELAGFAPDPEQRLGLDLLFAMDSRGKSAVFEFGVICARQNLKTGLFKQAALGWLFLTDQQLVVWSAHEFTTAAEAHRDMASLIQNCPPLARHVENVYWGSGTKSIELKTGQRLVFKARTASGGRGLTGDKVVLDEAFALRADHMGALLPTLSARPDPQIVYGSSAGMATSDTLRALRDRGRSGSSPKLAYLEWGAPVGGCAMDRCSHEPGVVEGCALDDVENWRRGNPMLGRTRANGTGLSLDYIAAERHALPPMEFARERLGWWDEPGVAETFGVGKWEACAGEPPSGVAVSALGVAVSMDLTRAAIVAAGRDGDGNTHVRPLQHGPGTAWVVERVAALQARHGASVIVDSRGPAAVLIPELERAVGDSLRVATTADVLDACAGMFARVQDARLRHASYPELDAAVASAVKRPVGDRWAWGRKASASDISALEAATLADWATNGEGVESVYETRGLVTL